MLGISFFDTKRIEVKVDNDVKIMIDGKESEGI